MDRKREFREWWDHKKPKSVFQTYEGDEEGAAECAFNAAIDLMESEIERLEKEVAELKAQNEAHKACFEKYIPVEKWDEATLFLSTHGSGLAKDMATREGLAPQESEASDE